MADWGRDRVTVSSGALTAQIAHDGAELVSLVDAAGREYMSDGDPAFWRGRAPLLFPIVGRLNGDVARIGGRDYPMAKHGFARRRTFDVIDTAADSVTLALCDDAATHAHYPFACALELRFAIVDAVLSMTAVIRNPGTVPLPASFGFHPAFAWPLPGGAARGDHRIVFAQPEPAALATITTDGLIGLEKRPSPVAGDTLVLRDELFADDALVWRTLASRQLRYGAPGVTTLDIAFPDTPWLGVWTKPGAAFVCIEPWAGCADPEGWTGAFEDKPGMMTIAPGSARSFTLTVAVSD